MARNINQGYVLPSCLILISMLMLLSLSLLDSARNEKQILTIQSQSANADFALILQVQNLAEEIKRTQNTCALIANNIQDPFFTLENKTLTNICLQNKQGIEMRYIMLTENPKTPGTIYLIAKDNINKSWHRFMLSI